MPKFVQIVEDPDVWVGTLRILRRVDGRIAVVDFSRPMLDRTIALGRTVPGAIAWARDHLRAQGVLLPEEEAKETTRT